MGRKRPASKEAGLQREPTPKKAKQSFNETSKGPKAMRLQGITPGSPNLQGNVNLSKKHSRPDDDKDESPTNMGKRLKINSNIGLAHNTADSEETITLDQPISIQNASESSAPAFPASPPSTDTASASTLPVEVQHLQDRYEFTPMSILSSAKIEQKVRNILERISKFSFAKTKQKPGVVILHAYANCASKMVSIAEIAKQQIQNENAKWYQYTKLQGELKPLKSKQPKRQGGGKTLAEWDLDRANSGDKATTIEPTEMGDGTVDTSTNAQENLNGSIDGDEESAFETMQPLTNADSGSLQAVERNKVRNTPVMTIYLAQVPVPALKELYGLVNSLLS